MLWRNFGNVFDSDDIVSSPVEEPSDSDDELMAVSAQAMNGTEGSHTIRLKGHMGD